MRMGYLILGLIICAASVGLYFAWGVYWGFIIGPVFLLYGLFGKSS